MKIYILCHHTPSEHKAALLCEKWNAKYENENIRFSPLFLPPSPFMESSCYPLLLHEEYKSDWYAHDYVGVITYSILDKLVSFSRGNIIDLNWSSIISSMKNKDLSVIGIMGVNYIRRGGAKLSLLEGSVFQHGFNFYRAWRLLLKQLGYAEEEYDRYYYTPGIICNWWIAKPALFLGYCQFMKKCMLTLRESENLKHVFMSNSHYGDKNTTPEQKKQLFGVHDYYPLHPFVFERLLSFYFLHQNLPTHFIYTLNLET